MAEIAEQIEHISRVANGWCNFALICGWIGFALALTAGIILFINLRKENYNGRH